jgi:hypothetical protein
MDIFLAGLPKFLNAKSYATRDRMLKHLRNQSQNHDTLSPEQALNNHWHPAAGSTPLQERERMYSQSPGHDHDARASQSLHRQLQLLKAQRNTLLAVSTHRNNPHVQHHPRRPQSPQPRLRSRRQVRGAQGNADRHTQQIRRPVDVEASKRLDPVWTEAALGTVRPTGNIPVRIKRRNV